MPAPTQNSALQITDGPTKVPTGRDRSYIRGAWAFSTPVVQQRGEDPLLTAEDVARRLNVSTDWVWDHSSRRSPQLPVIRMGDGTLRYRASGIEDFICEQERLSVIRRARR